MRIPKKMLLKSRGFSLVEILVVVGIMSIVAVGVMQIQTTDQMRLLSSRQMSSRDTVKMLADRYVLDYKIIKDSATSANYTALGSNFAGNEALDYCLETPAAPTVLCPAGTHPNCCKAVTDQPFHILEPSNPSVRFSGTDAASGGSFTTTSSSPVRYDINGRTCTSPGPECALELVSTYTATCPSGLPECSSAERIFINYSLRGSAGVTPMGGTPFKALSPSSPVPLEVSAAAGGGSSILQIKCAWYSNDFSTSFGHQTRPPQADCQAQISGSSGTTVEACTPLSCPLGWTNLGLSSEVTSTFLAGSTATYSDVRHSGNCIRTCVK